MSRKEYMAHYEKGYYATYSKTKQVVKLVSRYISEDYHNFKPPIWVVEEEDGTLLLAYEKNLLKPFQYS